MGKANASASAGERERKSLFKLCRCRRGRCRRRSPPRRLPSRRAAWVPGTRSRFEVGLRRRRAGERAAGRGKESAAPGRGCPLSVRPGETQDPVLRATLEGLTRPACLPKSAPRTWAQPVAPARLPAAPSPRRRPAAGARPRASAGGTRPRCGGSVQLLPAAPEARRAGSSSGCGRAFSLRLCALHLSRVTCRPRHQMSVLR